ncbi:MAG TPA: acyl carrier protein [Chthonomonadaceae bacterium]|nr:acyl carrier protein [Chthonomonadaceae bacterium]
MNDLDCITKLICEIGKLPAIGPDEIMMDAGFSSMNALQLLVELESSFDITIPDEDFITAQTPRALESLVTRLREE